MNQDFAILKTPTGQILEIQKLWYEFQKPLLCQLLQSYDEAHVHPQWGAPVRSPYKEPLQGVPIRGLYKEPL